jgi:hypothetical protein
VDAGSTSSNPEESILRVYQFSDTSPTTGYPADKRQGYPGWGFELKTSPGVGTDFSQKPRNINDSVVSKTSASLEVLGRS